MKPYQRIGITFWYALYQTSQLQYQNQHSECLNVIDLYCLAGASIRFVTGLITTISWSEGQDQDREVA